MENSLNFNFHEIWPRPCTIVQGLWSDFGATSVGHESRILIGMDSQSLGILLTLVCETF